MENNENKPTENKSFHDKQIEYHSQAKSDTEKWKQEIMQSQSIQNYLNQFHPKSTENFIDSYVRKKTSWMTYGESCKTRNENEALQWETAATRHLQYIQQKKLFDLQCLWRAENIQLDGIEICYDFEIWEEDILNCNLIEPVSEQDIDLYAQYLLQENLNAEDNKWQDCEWQDYNNIKEAYNNLEDADYNFPEWYEFHNSRTGAGTLMLLPDIRGEKEHFYEKLYYESIRKENEARYAEEEAKRDKRPWLKDYEKGFMEWFVNTFEDKQVREYYKAHTWNHRNSHLRQAIEDNVMLLLTADEYVPIEAHYNWIEALERATQKFNNKKIAEALPIALETYLMNIQAGIRFPDGKGVCKSVRHYATERILKGRVLNGEPADLNF